VWADRSRFLDPTGKDTCQMKKRIHCTCALFAIIRESSSGDTQSKFPDLPPRKDVVFKYWTLVSDDLIPHGRNSGQYTVTFKSNIEVTGKVCGTERILIHCKDKTVSTTNLITHVETMSKKCASRAAVDGVLKDVSPNYVNVNGEKQKIHTFEESFTHHVDLLAKWHVTIIR
jgi:hypothetical protein